MAADWAGRVDDLTSVRVPSLRSRRAVGVKLIGFRELRELQRTGISTRHATALGPAAILA